MAGPVSSGNTSLLLFSNPLYSKDLARTQEGMESLFLQGFRHRQDLIEGPHQRSALQIWTPFSINSF